jgi:hypothetical protein
MTKENHEFSFASTKDSFGIALDAIAIRTITSTTDYQNVIY